MAAIPYSAPQAVSADGSWILYVVLRGAQKGMGSTEWKLIHPDGTGERKIDVPKGFRPAGFMADGRLFGTWHSKAGPQIAFFALDALDKDSKPDVVITLPGGPQTVSLSPDGKRFATIIDPRKKDPLEGIHTVVQAPQASVYVVNADNSGGRWWSPELKNVSTISWSPDSSSLAVVSSVPKIGFHYMKSWIDVADGSTTKSIVTINNSIGDIAWSGPHKLAFVASNNSVLTPDSLYTVSPRGGLKNLTPSLPASVMDVVCDPTGTLWVTVNKGVRTEADRLINGHLVPTYTWPGGCTDAPTFCSLKSASPLKVVTVSDPYHCQNLAVPTPDGKLRRITAEGDRELANVSLGQTKAVRWTSKEHIRLEGIVTFPPSYKKGKRYPLVVVPHGGPEDNDHLVLRSDVQYLAALGYIVIQPQYRGSTGYGTPFLNAIYQHFGDRAYRDVDSAADYAIQQGWADPNRLAMFGWSAGGFMTSWTVTQTNRYKAAVEGAGITDWGSFIWTSDLFQFDYDGRWTDRFPQAFRQFSAVALAYRVKTPLLILHGEADQRVPTYQGREYFEELLAEGKTVRMVTYPGSGHFPSLWEQQLDVFRELGAWLKKYDP
jgi:dipeptidyl aminopeptidase/acylaminoacyl peptidase